MYFFASLSQNIAFLFRCLILEVALTRPLFVYLMEKITVSALVHADKNLVWECYTQPEHIVQWNFADPSWHCPRATNDLRVGGVYNARMEAKDGSFGFDFIAVYEDIQPKETLRYVFGDRRAEITFTLKDAGTEVTVTFDPETENPRELQQNGWQSILNNFKAYTENKA